MLGCNPSSGTLDGVIDVLNFVDNFAAGGTRGTWRTDLTSKGWSSSLQSAVSAGFTSMTLAALPRSGSILSILDATPEAALLKSVTGTSSPFAAQIGLAGINAHSAGATVVEKAATMDGTHPGDVIAQYVADNCYASQKLAGIFG
jgi:hypothetical protein